jgi:hypothetical protein
VQAAALNPSAAQPRRTRGGAKAGPHLEEQSWA